MKTSTLSCVCLIFFVSINVACFGQSRIRASYCGDLDGDGKEEYISFVCRQDRADSGFNAFEISIRNTVVNHYGVNLTGGLRVVDIDTSDSYQEIAVAWQGPSDDPETQFFRYIDGNIISLGVLPGYTQNCGRDLVIDGSGYVVTKCTGDVLGPWIHDCRFSVRSDHRFEEDVRTFYECNRQVILEDRLTLLKSPTDSTVVAELESGDDLAILGCDNVQWCKVSTRDRVEGWVELKGCCRLADGRNVHSVFRGIWVVD